jgi:hypothetical protein
MIVNLTSIFVLLTGLSILTISSILIIGTTESYSQTDATKSQSSINTVHIIKDASNSYALSSGSSHIGTFDTSYMIIGSIPSLKESKNLISSTITKDYASSPVIGYVIAHKNKSDSTSTTLANPFADKATINEKIKSKILTSIDSSQKLKTAKAEIKCNFGMEISDWKCSTHSILD